MNPFEKALAGRIAQRIVDVGLTQSQIARVAKCNPSFVSQVVGGTKVPALKHLPDWAKALRWSLLDMLPGGADLPDQPPSLPVVRATALRAGKRRPADARKRVEALLKATGRRLDLPKAWLREGREHFVVVADASGVALGILPGDHLVVEVGLAAAPGDTILAVMDGDPALRRCADLDGETIVLPAPGTDETARRLSETEILGIARHVIRLGKE